MVGVTYTKEMQEEATLAMARFVVRDLRAGQQEVTLARVTRIVFVASPAGTTQASVRRAAKQAVLES